MSRFVIRNGKIYDPANNVHGDVRDIFVDNGKIVDAMDMDGVEVVDADGMIVAPGNVEIHSHIAGPKLTIGRLLRPEDHIRDVVKSEYPLRSGVGFSIPTTFITAYRYLTLGYTTLMEAAVPPLEARHTLDELEDMPVVDKGMYILMGNNNILFSLLKEKEYDMARDFVGWLLKATGGYAIKVVNPGGTDSWKWGKIFNSLRDETVWGIRPIDVLKLLVESVEYFHLPHPVHLHTYNLGSPGSYNAALDTIHALGDYSLHLTHLQYYCYGGDSWSTFRSEAEEVAAELRDHPKITADMGQVLFEDTTTMTADTPWQYKLHMLTGNRWVSTDVEVEAGSGIVPYRYKRSSIVNAVQWATGLELALMLSPWQIFLTTDSPNGGPFFMYPEVIRWLTSEDARQDVISSLPSSFKRRTILGDIHRELSLEEIIVMMSSGPAKALGLKNRGHLGIGADADIAIYKERGSVADTLSRVHMLFKSGELVVDDGKIVSGELVGKLFVVDTGVDDEVLGDKVARMFDEFYSVSFSNYRVEDVYLRNREVVCCG